VTLPWTKFATCVPGDGAWASMRIFVPRRFRRSQQLVATLETSAWFPVDDDLPDIRCLGVMVAERQVGGDATIRIGARAIKVPRLRAQVREAERRLSALTRRVRARLAVRRHATAAIAALKKAHRPQPRSPR